MKTTYKIIIGIFLAFGVSSNAAFAQDDISDVKQECKLGMFVAYKIDNSKSACVTPSTLDKLIARSWAFGHDGKDGIYVDANSAAENFIGCNVNQIPIQGGYFLLPENPIEFLEIRETTRDGYKGFGIIFHNPTDKVFSPRGPVPYIFADCLSPPAQSFTDCIDNRSRLFNDDKWPILECTTRNEEFFSINDADEKKKRSGISIYTMNFLSSQTLEIVGKTDRTDAEISFGITAPNGDEISEWREFAVSEGEFKTTVTTGGPLWEEQDGFYTITATQDISYYAADTQFELRGGVIIPEHVSALDYMIETENVTYGNQYKITGGTIDEITYDAGSNSIAILLIDAEEGYVEIVIPSDLLFSNNKTLGDYSVLLDGKEIIFGQLSPILLKIPFEKETKKIEIVGLTE